MQVTIVKIESITLVVKGDENMEHSIILKDVILEKSITGNMTTFKQAMCLDPLSGMSAKADGYLTLAPQNGESAGTINLSKELVEKEKIG